MSRQPSWREVADLLASRLAHQAACAEGHLNVTPGCPFCDDVVAYQVYLRKAGLTGERADIVGDRVSLAELMSRRDGAP